MKTKFLIIFSVIFTVGLFSCESMLDRYPKDQLSGGSFWKSMDDAERFTADIYTNVLPWFGTTYNDNGSDDVVPSIKWMDSSEGQGIYNPANYGWSYSTVRQANLLLENVDLITNATEEQKAVVKGEARFFRAYFYSGMITSYGDVPYVEKTLAPSELEIPRTPVAEMYPKVVADFEYAAANLNLVEGGARYGRLTKGAALTALADFQIYLASFPEYQSFVTYADAAATCKRIIDLGVYGLWDEGGVKGNYREFFWQAGDGSNENIFIRVCGEMPYGSGNVTFETIPNIGWGGTSPTQSLVDAFEDTEGAPISKSKIYDPKEPWKNRDLRFETCIGYHGQYLDGNNWNFYLSTVPYSYSEPEGRKYVTGISTDNGTTPTGYYGIKWNDRSITPESINQDWIGPRDMTVYRFAEVLLWYAEATNEVSGPTSEVFSAINRIRARVRQPLLQSNDGSKPTFVADKQDMRERIRSEYRAEMAIEGRRFSAIRRWRTQDGKPLAMKVMNEPMVGMPFDYATETPFVGPNVMIPARPDGRRFEEHNLLSPIPLSEMDLNPLLKQNPGYN